MRVGPGGLWWGWSGVVRVGFISLDLFEGDVGRAGVVRIHTPSSLEMHRMFDLCMSLLIKC